MFTDNPEQPLITEIGGVKGHTSDGVFPILNFLSLFERQVDVLGEFFLF